MKKGISPLIAGVLLIAFTLAVAAIISGWLTSVARTTTSKAETGIETQVECSKANIEITKVDTTSNLVVIHNIGRVNLTGFTVTCGANVKHYTNTVNIGEFLTLTPIPACSSGEKIVVASTQCPTATVECTIGECPE